MRTFIAINLDEKLLEALHQITQSLQQQPHQARIKWSPKENYHLTLRFLGEIPAEKIPEIKELLSTVLQNIAPFELPLGKTMLFPPTTHPHMIAHSVELTIELANLVQIIEKAMNQCGFAPEDRPYLPHITLGRFNRDCDLDFKLLPQHEGQKTLAVNEVILYRSELKETGSVYTALHHFKLYPK